MWKEYKQNLITMESLSISRSLAWRQRLLHRSAATRILRRIGRCVRSVPLSPLYCVGWHHHCATDHLQITSSTFGEPPEENEQLYDPAGHSSVLLGRLGDCQMMASLAILSVTQLRRKLCVGEPASHQESMSRALRTRQILAAKHFGSTYRSSWLKTNT